MNALVTIGVAVAAMIAVGFILYLLRLNRRAKREQSEVDPAKLRKWSDDCSRASAQSATPAGQRISCNCAKQFISCLWVEPLAGLFGHGVGTFLLHTFHYFLLFRRLQCLDVVLL